ncbi:MAG: hypothetical protein R3E96_07800 [Planctomycetota bacterium]
MLGRAVEYQGHVDRLVLADERGNGVQGELRDTDFKLSWMPQGAAHFELDGTFADSGEVHGQFDWQGMGEGFALGSLVGELTLEGPSAWLGTLLGMPESLPNICGPRVKLTLHLGQKGGAPEGPLAVRLELGQTGAFGMAFDGSFDGRTLTQLPEHTCELQVMHSHLALSALLGMLCDSWPSAVRGLNLAWEEEGLQLWRVRLNNLVSHRVPRRPDLSLVEGFFAASDFDLTVENTTRLSLESREVGANGRLPLGNLDMKWNWSATEGRGQGMLETKSSEARMRGVDAALGFELASNLGELLTPMLRMSWSTERPYPWLQPAVEHLALLSAPTSFFPRIGPAWTADAAAILGKACSIELTAREFQDAPGGASEGWQLQVRGSSLQSEVDLCVAQDRIWSLPGMPGSLVLPVGGKAGVYSVLLAPFLPWFADLRPEPGSPADSVHSVLEYTDLAWKREAGGWKLDQGELSFVPGELEYEIAAPWQVAWLRDDTLLGEEVGETRFQVKGNTVSYELAGFPVGNLQGSIDLASGLVQMTLGQLRPPLSLVLSMDKGKALLGSLKDLRWHDPTQTPDPGR